MKKMKQRGKRETSSSGGEGAEEGDAQSCPTENVINYIYRRKDPEKKVVFYI